MQGKATIYPMVIKSATRSGYSHVKKYEKCPECYRKTFNTDQEKCERCGHTQKGSRSFICL